MKSRKRLPLYALSASVLMVLAMGCALAEGEPETRWVLCDGVLNVRQSARGGSEVTGYLYCGDAVTVDKYAGNGAWAHVTDIGTEAGEGWVVTRFLCMEEVTVPVECTDCLVAANGRVAVRDGIDGKRLYWVKPGATVTALAWSDSYVVISGGIISRAYVTMEGEEDAVQD